MQAGVWIPNCGHLATPDVIRRTAVRAEQLGYDSVWVSDHVVVPNAYLDRIGAGIYDPLVTLAVAAGATGRVRLGTTVIAELAAAGVEHLVIEFLAADGPELDEQMTLFAERVRPGLA